MFSRPHKKIYHDSMIEIGYRKQQLEELAEQEQEFTTMAKESLKVGKTDVAEQYAGALDYIQQERTTLELELNDLQHTNVHAGIYMRRSGKSGKRLKGIVSYSEREAKLADDFNEPIALQLRESANNLRKATEAGNRAKEGMVGKTYVPKKSKSILAQLRAELDTENKEEYKTKEKIKEAAQAAQA